MPEHDLPEGIRSWRIWRSPGSVLGGAVDHIEGGPLPEFAVDVVPVLDLPAIEAAAVQREWERMREVFAPEIEAARREVGEGVDLAASYREEGRTTKAEIAENKAREASNRLAALDTATKGDGDGS